MTPGYIYILTNPSLKQDMLKIGRTADNPVGRAAAVSSASGIRDHTAMEPMFLSPPRKGFDTVLAILREAEEMLNTGAIAAGASGS